MGEMVSLPLSLAFGPYSVSKLQFFNEEFDLKSSRQRNLACCPNSIITNIPLVSSPGDKNNHIPLNLVCLKLCLKKAAKFD